MIDLTDLSDDHAADGMGELCRRARLHRTAGVCVWPEFVATCAAHLRGSGVRVATVVNFPTGDEPISKVIDATRLALGDGADDIDLVLPYSAFLSGQVEQAAEMVSSIAAMIERPRMLKVILESGVYPELAAVTAAARLAIEAGADFLKTSTGKVGRGATLEAAQAMLVEIAQADRVVGLKPSGGIRSFDDASAYLALADGVMGDGWAIPSTFRFGASGLLDALLGELGELGNAPPASRAY